MELIFLIAAVIATIYVVIYSRKYKRINKQKFLNSSDFFELNKLSNEITILAIVAISCLGLFFVLLFKTI